MIFNYDDDKNSSDIAMYLSLPMSSLPRPLSPLIDKETMTKTMKRARYLFLSNQLFAIIIFIIEDPLKPSLSLIPNTSKGGGGGAD